LDLDFNFSVPFVFVNESDGVAAMAVWKVPDGTTLEALAVGGVVEVADFDADMRGMVEAPADGPDDGVGRRRRVRAGERSLDPEWRAGPQFWSAFGPREDAKRQNMTRAIE